MHGCDNADNSQDGGIAHSARQRHACSRASDEHFHILMSKLLAAFDWRQVTKLDQKPITALVTGHYYLNNQLIDAININLISYCYLSAFVHHMLISVCNKLFNNITDFKGQARWSFTDFGITRARCCRRCADLANEEPSRIPARLCHSHPVHSFRFIPLLEHAHSLAEREREREVLHPCSQPCWADRMEHFYMAFWGNMFKADVNWHNCHPVGTEKYI